MYSFNRVGTRSTLPPGLVTPLLPDAISHLQPSMPPHALQNYFFRRSQPRGGYGYIFPALRTVAHYFHKDSRFALSFASDIHGESRVIVGVVNGRIRVELSQLLGTRLAYLEVSGVTVSLEVGCTADYLSGLDMSG